MGKEIRFWGFVRNHIYNVNRISLFSSKSSIGLHILGSSIYKLIFRSRFYSKFAILNELLMTQKNPKNFAFLKGSGVRCSIVYLRIWEIIEHRTPDPFILDRNHHSLVEYHTNTFKYKGIQCHTQKPSLFVWIMKRIGFFSCAPNTTIDPYHNLIETSGKGDI